MNELAKGERVKKAQFRLRRNSYLEGKEGRNRPIETDQGKSLELLEAPEITVLPEDREDGTSLHCQMLRDQEGHGRSLQDLEIVTSKGGLQAG